MTFILIMTLMSSTGAVSVSSIAISDNKACHEAGKAWKGEYEPGDFYPSYVCVRR